MISRSVKDKIMQGIIFAASGFTIMILALIVGFIFIKGVPKISVPFLMNDYDDKTTYITTDLVNEEDSNLSMLGIQVALDDSGQSLKVTEVKKNSPLKKSLDMKQNEYPVKKGDYITQIDQFDIDELLAEDSNLESVIGQVESTLASDGAQNIRLKVVRPGGGILPMFITTIYMVLLALAVAAPIGILSAVYLNEYATQGKAVTLIRFAIQNLAGIPSIIYGLFGALFFVQMCNMKYSILAGALTVSLLLLPVMISTTEETLKAIPKAYRESSLGLGATKLQTTMKIVLPNALPGILVAVLLSIGRIVGESAALLLTAGTVSRIPGALVGQEASGATLTIKAYMLLKEEGNIEGACAIGVVLIALIFLLNFSSKAITNRFLIKKNS